MSINQIESFIFTRTSLLIRLENNITKGRPLNNVMEATTLMNRFLKHFVHVICASGRI
jgi:hypothetical protein